MAERTLLEYLEAYARSDYYPCHMPGHKRNLPGVSADYTAGLQALAAAAALDITEIEGFDNLHKPEGILKEAMERAARLYGADRCYYSINGSTAGILTAVSAAVPEGSKLIMARNCHRAVYHAAYLRRLETVYLYPGVVPGTQLADIIGPEQVERALADNPDAAAVLLTSPTYDGVTADLKEIIRIVHNHNIPLIVDAAHGAHFGLHPAFPEGPARLGADLTVVSLHKTMPCMTQTALLLSCGGRVGEDRIRMFESMYQTSSPSYFLMAGMDECMFIAEKQGPQLWKEFWEDRAGFLKKTAQLRHFKVITAGKAPFEETVFDDKMAARIMDPGKILIETSKTGLTGSQFYDILLERYHLQMEMAAGDYVTAIMTCCDRKEGWNRLAEALYEEDGRCSGAAPAPREPFPYPFSETCCSLSEALDAPKERLPLQSARGRICGAFLNLYPPGIPIVVPGERISREALELILHCRQYSLPIQGLEEDAITILKRSC